MELAKGVVEFIFGAALFINARLFIPQALRILKTKSAKGISLLTFLGFFGIQLAIVVHGLIHQDALLVIGYLLSMITCGMVVLLAWYYRDTSPENLDNNLIEMLENILALMPGHVYWVDSKGTYLGCNDNQAKSAGLPSRKEIISKRNQDLPWNYNQNMLPEALDKINTEVMETGRTITVEEPALLQDGTQVVFLSTKAPIRNRQGRIMGMVGISIDITERKKAEAALVIEKHKAEAANQAKTEFLENMRHDIRTPLSGMVSGLALLSHTKEERKIKQYTNQLLDASQELLRFLNEVLESIQVASGEIPLLKKKFNLKDILEKVIKLSQPIAHAKNVSLGFTFDHNIPPYLIGDSDRIYRIVLELLVNALKFTPAGYVTVSTKLAQKNERDLVVQIEVADTGPGIPTEQQSNLFVRFKRLTPSYQDIYRRRPLFPLVHMSFKS